MQGGTHCFVGRHGQVHHASLGVVSQSKRILAKSVERLLVVPHRSRARRRSHESDRGCDSALHMPKQGKRVHHFTAQQHFSDVHAPGPRLNTRWAVTSAKHAYVCVCADNVRKA